MNQISIDAESAPGYAPTQNTDATHSSPARHKLTIKSDAAGIPHVYDAAGVEIQCTGFTLDYDRAAGICYVSVVLPAEVLLDDIQGYYLE